MKTEQEKYYERLNNESREAKREQQKADRVREREEREYQKRERSCPMGGNLN